MGLYRRRSLAVLLVCLVATIALAADRISDLRSTVIVVSIDGFRPDYLDRVDTPNLHSIMERGVHAKYLIPSFPTKTFPNHYTIATGLYPAHHGIIANYMYDPDLKERFNKNSPEAAKDSRWWGGEPIWITAEKQGIRTAPLMWPGGLVDHDGVSPSYREDYDKAATSVARVDKLVSLLALPGNERPQLLTLYLDVVDEAGHHFGPHSAEVRRAVSEADSSVGRLLEALRERGIEDQVNLVVVSDHGMASVSRKKTVIIDDYLDLKTVDVVDGSPIVSLIPNDGNVRALYEKVKRIPHAKAYLATDLPERWHFSGSPRITPVIVVADDDWTINSRDYLAKHSKLDLGNHGFDNAAKDMHAIFMAQGPSFDHGTMKPFANIHLYSLFAYLLNIVPAKTDGSIDVFKNILVQRSESHPTRRLRAPWQKEWDQVGDKKELEVSRW